MRLRWTLALPLLCAACLENEEEVTVQRDGSLHVVVRAKGDAPDLAGGYAVPCGWPWAAADADTRLWLAEIGPDTGGAQARTSVEQRRAGELWKDEVTLTAEATFRDAADWPERSAPADAPYADAYSRRSARLEVRHIGARTVYAFTRTYHAPAHGVADPSHGLVERLPEDVVQKLEDEEPLSPAEWEALADAVRDAYAEGARAFARGAALPIYTAGDASLDPSRVAELVEAHCFQPGDLVADARRLARPVRHRLEVAAWTERLDLGCELLEERGDLVEPVAVLALNLLQPLAAPGAEALVPVLRSLLGPASSRTPAGSRDPRLLGPARPPGLRARERRPRWERSHALPRLHARVRRLPSRGRRRGTIQRGPRPRSRIAARCASAARSAAPSATGTKPTRDQRVAVGSAGSAATTYFRPAVSTVSPPVV